VPNDGALLEQTESNSASMGHTYATEDSISHDSTAFVLYVSPFSCFGSYFPNQTYDLVLVFL